MIGCCINVELCLVLWYASNHVLGHLGWHLGLHWLHSWLHWLHSWLHWLHSWLHLRLEIVRVLLLWSHLIRVIDWLLNNRWIVSRGRHTAHAASWRHTTHTAGRWHTHTTARVVTRRRHSTRRWLVHSSKVNYGRLWNIHRYGTIRSTNSFRRGDTLANTIRVHTDDRLVCGSVVNISLFRQIYHSKHDFAIFWSSKVNVLCNYWVDKIVIRVTLSNKFRGKDSSELFSNLEELFDVELWCCVNYCSKRCIHVFWCSKIYSYKRVSKTIHAI